MMTPSRIAAALVLSLQVALAYAVTSGTWPKWTAWLGVALVFVQAFVHYVGWDANQLAAARAAAKRVA